MSHTWDDTNSGGEVRALFLGGETAVSAWQSSGGNHVVTLVALAGNNQFAFHASGDGDFSIERVKVEKL
jgi:hypothetical protein